MKIFWLYNYESLKLQPSTTIIKIKLTECIVKELKLLLEKALKFRKLW